MLHPGSLLAFASLSLLACAQPLRLPVVEGISLECPSPRNGVLLPRGDKSSPIHIDFNDAHNIHVDIGTMIFYGSDKVIDPGPNATSDDATSLAETSGTRTTSDCPPNVSCPEPNSRSSTDVKAFSTTLKNPSATSKVSVRYVEDMTTDYNPTSTLSVACVGCSEAGIATQYASAPVS